jgi:hypothetical protein
MDCVILLPEGWKRELHRNRRLSMTLVQAVAEEEEELLLAATRLSSFAPDSSPGCYLKE